MTEHLLPPLKPIAMKERISLLFRNYSACFVRIIGMMFHPVSIKAGFLPWKSNLKAKVAAIPCLRQVDR